MTKDGNSMGPPDVPIDVSFPSRRRYVNEYGEDFIEIVNNTLDRTAPVWDWRFYNVVQTYCRIDNDQVKPLGGKELAQKKYEIATEAVAKDSDLSTERIREVCRDHYECSNPTKKLVDDLQHIDSETNAKN